LFFFLGETATEIFLKELFLGGVNHFFAPFFPKIYNFFKELPCFGSQWGGGGPCTPCPPLDPPLIFSNCSKRSEQILFCFFLDQRANFILFFFRSEMERAKRANYILLFLRSKMEQAKRANFILLFF